MEKGKFSRFFFCYERVVLATTTRYECFVIKILERSKTGMGEKHMNPGNEGKTLAREKCQ